MVARSERRHRFSTSVTLLSTHPQSRIQFRRNSTAFNSAPNNAAFNSAPPKLSTAFNSTLSLHKSPCRTEKKKNQLYVHCVQEWKIKLLASVGMCVISENRGHVKVLAREMDLAGAGNFTPNFNTSSLVSVRVKQIRPPNLISDGCHFIKPIDRKHNTKTTVPVAAAGCKEEDEEAVLICSLAKRMGRRK
ncbi:hypothetical protein H6P81_003027 [Aristolochia fimbriata]|uniref:Uncharacterized protein n=1 Tax=Aristolochia fimbriata TaxID=158543 RepID=A0AAV7FBZ9_ARIFI|nr:hypothetical protein H6P81_003027 [Aristolochia fimbriata]